MGTEENKRLIHLFYEAGNRGDTDTCLALMADEVNQHWHHEVFRYFRGQADPCGKFARTRVRPVRGRPYLHD